MSRLEIEQEIDNFLAHQLFPFAHPLPKLGIAPQKFCVNRY
ncbi:hypothetical protein MiSe_87510 [Microseira wollei NIES-4236]|uniref:Uncharacterized protein n=1 Tax=Microseira wollei NIES-4236 TaxID=2530354 RepID=A0AAV3XPS9_9CYAN|nr:hypothetical protein MiSe_87510 [Microseira wollei NIES-4236]